MGNSPWTIPDSVAPGTNYRVEVTRADDPALGDQSNNAFTITSPVHVYWVNDGTLSPGDWTSAPGDAQTMAWTRAGLKPRFAQFLILITGLLQTRPSVAWRAHGSRLFRIPGLAGRPR